MFNVTTILPHNFLQMNPWICHNFLTQVFRKGAAQLHYVGPELHYIFWPPKTFWRLVLKSCDECKGLFSRGCEAKRWSHWTHSSLGTIFQPMRINSVSDVKCFCNNKNVLHAQSMVWHFVHHLVYSPHWTKRILQKWWHNTWNATVLELPQLVYWLGYMLAKKSNHKSIPAGYKISQFPEHPDWLYALIPGGSEVTRAWIQPLFSTSCQG